MPDDVVILRLEDREPWEAAHRYAGLPTQSWGYAIALRSSGIDTRLAIVRSGGARMLMPFFERPFLGTVDIATIPGLSGASIEPNSTAPLRLWQEYARAQNWICGYIQLGPNVQFAEPVDAGEIVAHNEVFILDLRQPDISSTFSNNLKRKIRDGVGRGATLVEDRDVIAASLRHLHPAAMDRLVGNRFAPETLDGWAYAPDWVGIGARIGDRLEAVHLYAIAGNYAEGHLAATSETGRGLGAWVIWNAILRLQKIGVHALNIGGGGRIGDGLYRHKRGFNVGPTPLRSVRQIYDRRRYTELCERAGVLARGTWFPAYRAKPAPIETAG